MFVLLLCQCADTSEAQEGDPRYLAPELLQGRFAKSADIFRCVNNCLIGVSSTGHWFIVIIH